VGREVVGFFIRKRSQAFFVFKLLVFDKLLTLGMEQLELDGKNEIKLEL
jgi:hypothetical protein